MIRMYTDGACSSNPGPGGWAVVINTNEGCKTLSGSEANTTNNRMELMAVLEAYKEILKMKPGFFQLLSDSAYVVNSINKGWLSKWLENGWKTTSKNGTVKNKDLWKELLKAMDKAKNAGYKISIIKVKGHAGNSFNELADQIAKRESLKLKD